MELALLNNKFSVTKCIVIWAVFGQVLLIYVPNEIDQSPKPYTTGIKLKTSHYKAVSEPYYHSNYSKVYVHNKNYTSSLLDSAGGVSKPKSYSQSSGLYPVYISEEKKEKIKNVIKEHNTNVVDKDSLNNRVVYKRRIEKAKNIEVYNKCPTGITGQFVYDASCNQYLDCWNGRGGPRNCAPGTLFNPKTLECDFPEKVECLTGPSANSLTLQRSAKLQNHEQAKCPQGFSGLIPNYTDCTKFVQCNNGIQTPGTCPPGTLFDVNLNVCNHPDQTTCFSGQLGTSYIVKEQFGGSSDVTGQYKGQAVQYQVLTSQNKGVARQHQGATRENQRQTLGQYQGQAGPYQGKTDEYQGLTVQNHDVAGQYQGQIGHYQGKTGQNQIPDGPYPGLTGQGGQYGQFFGQTNSLEQSQSRDGRQYYQTGDYQPDTVRCDPTSPYCHSGGYIISGQNLYRNPQTPSGAKSYVGSSTSSNFGQSSQFYGGSVEGGGQSQDSVGTAYIQYVVCNPNVENCSNFQQGVYILGPGGSLCNPIQQNCNPSQQYIPGTKMRDQTRPGTVPQSGVYYVKYVLCNPLQEDCSKYQKGIVEATYGVPAGTPAGAQPVTDYGTAPSQIPPECNPQVHNCDTVRYYGQSQTLPCDPQYQNCGQDSRTGGGFETHRQGQGDFQTAFQGNYPNTFNGSTNYKKICSAGDKNCYQAKLDTPTKTYEIHGGQPKCPEGFQGITKHPTSCNKFLNCANGITFVQDCGPGTLFNPLLLVCDHPYNVDCKDGDEDETTTLNYFVVYGQGSTTPQKTTCQGSHCIQGQGYGQQGQYGGDARGHVGDAYGQTGCQGSQCRKGQFGQVQTSCQGSQCYPDQFGQGQVGQNHLGQGQAGCQGSQCYQSQFEQQPSQSGCQGPSCINKSKGQGQDGGQYEGQPGGSYNGNQQGRGECQGSQCSYTPHQGVTSIKQGHSCRGVGCFTQINHGYVIPSSQSQEIYASTQSSTNCQGYQCRSSKGQISQHQYPVDRPNSTTTQKTYAWPPQGSRKPVQGSQDSVSQGRVVQDNENQSHVMKILSNNNHHQVTPINKSDRVTHGGFNNEKSIDYVDIFNPDESRNFAYATTTPRSRQKPEKQVWPPPFSDFVTTDPNADYVFEYEDGEPVTLAPEKINPEKRKKTRCDSSDFVCDKKSCVSKNFVCDGIRDCDDGKDEKYCQKYLDEFKPFKNSRLDVLERQRWDNISHATCALLCMDTEKFECKSFNYRKVDRACFLTSENVGTSGELKSYYPCDYYERKSTSADCSDRHKCPNGKCLTSVEICDGYDDCGDRADEKGCRAEDFGYKVRLAGGGEENEGRAEVTVFGITGYICDDQFSITDAGILCKELGFHLGAAEVKGNSYYAKDLQENHTLYMMDDIECVGNESSIMHCNFAGWGIHNCADKEIAGVVCKTPEETCSEGFWKCDSGNECVKLPFLCDGLDDCTDNSDEASHHCDAPTDFRLVNGSKPSEGRLEIRHHEIWGSVCDDDFNDDAAKIVCSYLGYFGSAYVKKDAYFGESSGPIWLDQVSCYGNETAIDKCSHWEWGSHNCDHSEDVGIVCSNELMNVDAQRSSKSVSGGVSSSIKNSGTGALSPEPGSCGFRKDNIFLEGDDVHFRVVHGSLAKPGDYPWQAALRINGHDKTAHWCGAVVIASKWVLTAAHCLEGYPKGSYVVVAGEYNMDEDEGTEQQAFIDEYYLHENFRKGHKMANDIAMIKLKGNGFRLNQDIQPICLPDETSDYDRDLNCTISGFGTVQTGKSVYSHKLRAAWIPIQKMDVCKMAHIYGEAIGEGMICAGDLNGGVDACDGDSGGPLACLEDGMFTLYGLTSWGQRCGYANKPGVYVKVSHYKKWIETIMKVHF